NTITPSEHAGPSLEQRRQPALRSMSRKTAMSRPVAGSGMALISRRGRFAAALGLVLVFTLYWYGAFLSFPLLGEDAANLLSTLLETIKDGHLATLSYPIKWLEGLGQPNPFVTFSFDPFAWPLLLPLDPADAFRLSMALRAT